MSVYKNKATKNIIISIMFRVIILIVGLVSRRYMVNYLGNEITGIYSLFVSILGFLAVAELGIGTAITFSMYKPIVDEDKDKVSALYYLYRKIYLIIFLIITIVGILLTPIIPMLAKEATIGNEIYITYIIFLISTSITYLYAYRTSFINAHMDNYITNSIRSIFQIIEYIVQIFIILVTGSFFWFLIILLISNIMQWLTTNCVFNKRYKEKINDNKSIDDKMKADITQKIKAMFLHKIGGLLVNTTDSLIIGAFIGVVLLGIYSNYVLILTSMMGILSLVFVSIVSVLGHTYAKVSKKSYNNAFNKMYLLNYIIAMIFFLGFFSISDELITLIFNNNVILDKDITLILTFNYFLWFSKQAATSFRDASGIFYHDRYKPLFEAIVNLILSLLLVRIWGLFGIIVATIITNLTITHLIEPFVLYKYAFESSPKKYYLFNYIGITFFVLLLLVFYNIPFPKYTSIYISLLVKGMSSVVLSTLSLFIFYLVSKTFRITTKTLFNDIKQYLKKNK